MVEACPFVVWVYRRPRLHGILYQRHYAKTVD